MKMKLLIIIAIIGLVSCSSDDDATTEPILGCNDENSLNYNSDATEDDGSCLYSLDFTLNFKQNWDGQNVTIDDFGTTEFSNENGEVLKIQKLRYLISKVVLHSDDAEDLELDGYNLVDLSDSNTLSVVRNAEVQDTTYTRISFVYEFNEEDNITNEYVDLNTASWNWPGMLGGGYHFMQFEGTFTNTNTVNPLPFAYHNGTARVSDGVFEQNFITVTVDDIDITGNAVIDLKMNLAEWFKNPKTWDLNVLNTGLMGNYDAQREMNENGQSVFSVYLGD